MKIAMFADSHLGYKSGDKNINGINLREQDGYDALHAIVSGIIDEGVDAVVHGGDLFHTPMPSIRAIKVAHKELRRLVNAGIPVFITSGNHDTSDILADLPATASVEEAGINVVEDMEQTFEADTGLRIFVVSHRGVESAGDIVSPVDGDVNILVSHASVEEEGSILHTEDAPREKVLQSSALDLPWSAVLLGHIHNRHFVKGRENVFYAGSALRRGFSDNEGDRGWTLVEVTPSGLVTYSHHNISQRPQFDLGVVDASGMTGAEVEDLILGKVSEIPDLSIARIAVSGCAPTTRREIPASGLSEQRQRLLRFDHKFLPLEKDPSTMDVAARQESFGDDAAFKKWADSNAILETLSDDRKARVIDASQVYVQEAQKRKIEES